MACYAFQRARIHHIAGLSTYRLHAGKAVGTRADIGVIALLIEGRQHGGEWMFPVPERWEKGSVPVLIPMNGTRDLVWVI